jgi:hypothetical protein
MSKKYIDKPCAYCVGNLPSEPDHIFARGFFLPEDRNNLPKVPACRECNKKKSDLEHYLTAVLPFGARHDSAIDNLTKMVPKRLAKNLPLKRSIQYQWKDVTKIDIRDEDYQLAVSVHPHKILQLFDYIVRGLVLYHWCQYLDSTVAVDIYPVTDVGEMVCDSLLKSARSKRVINNLGNGTIIYKGVQSFEYPQLNVWKIEMYGRMQFVNSTEASASSSCIYIFTSLP